MEGLAKREPFVCLRAFDGRGIFDSPMRGHRLTGPYRAGLARGVVANGKDEVELGRPRLRKLIPTLAAHAVRGHFHVLEELECNRVDLTLWAAAGTEAHELAAAPVIDQRLGEDAAR